MPVFLLLIKAELENIDKLSIAKDHSFCLSVKESGGAETKDNVYVSSSEEHELQGSRGSANLVMKFSRDSKECSINVKEIKGLIRDYTAEDDRRFVPIMAFECRGIEPVAFSPGGDWTVVSKGGKRFEDVDLSEKEWTDFDDKINEPVGLYDFESRFEVHK